LYEGQEAERFLHTALNRLDPEQREVVVLRDVQGLSYEDIARITGHRLGTVKSRLHRGRVALSTAYRSWKSGTVPKETAS